MIASFVKNEVAPVGDEVKPPLVGVVGNIVLVAVGMAHCVLPTVFVRPGVIGVVHCWPIPAVWPNGIA